MPKEVLDYQPPVDIRELIGDLTLAKLQNIFNSIIKRQEKQGDPTEANLARLRKKKLVWKTK